MDDTKIINGMFHTHIFIGLRCMTCDNDGLISSCLYKRTSICTDGVEVSKQIVDFHPDVVKSKIIKMVFVATPLSTQT
jgi:predicted nuclease of restriction endonuclease-like (RecB) superfamily